MRLLIMLLFVAVVGACGPDKYATDASVVLNWDASQCGACKQVNADAGGVDGGPKSCIKWEPCHRDECDDWCTQSVSDCEPDLPRIPLCNP